MPDNLDQSYPINKAQVIAFLCSTFLQRASLCFLQSALQSKAEAHTSLRPDLSSHSQAPTLGEVERARVRVEEGQSWRRELERKEGAGGPR